MQADFQWMDGVQWEGVDTLHLSIYPVTREEAEYKWEVSSRHVAWWRLRPGPPTSGTSRSFRIARKKGGEVGGQRSRGAGRGQMAARGWTKGPGIHQSKKGATFAGLGQPSGRPRPRIFSRIAARGWSCFGLRTSPSPACTRPGRAVKGRRNPPHQPVLLLRASRVWWGKRVFTSVQWTFLVRWTLAVYWAADESRVRGVLVGWAERLMKGGVRWGKWYGLVYVLGMVRYRD